MLQKAQQLQKDLGGFAGAEYLHKNITGERWGITAKELEHGFVKKVKAMLDAGEVTNESRFPYPQEKFDNSDIGPNMYQINEQVIMPVTKREELEFPGVSWSLMSNPLGHHVTIFVTHAWAEGMFEFANSVLEQWPDFACGTDGVEHSAYICFLSNPQHLDISGMLNKIDTSPFKVALDKMPKPGLVIVAPTTACPIHSRLWCVAELFWASEQGIPIVVGGDRRALADAEMQDVAETAVEDVAKSRSARSTAAWRLKPLGCCCCVVLPCLSLLAAVMIGTYAPKETECEEEGRTDCGADMAFDYLIPIPFVLLACSVCGCCLFIWTMVEAGGTIRKTEQEAGRGAFIDIRKAKCTVDADAERIRAAIAGKEDMVNERLGNLILYGKSAWA